jgi:hypothetical protein
MPSDEEPSLLGLVVFALATAVVFMIGIIVGGHSSTRKYLRKKQKKKAKKAGKIDFPAVLVSAIKKIPNPASRPLSSVIVLAGEGLAKTETYLYVAEIAACTMRVQVERHLEKVLPDEIIPDFLLRKFRLKVGNTWLEKRIQIPIEEEDFDAKKGSSGQVIVHFNPFDPKDKPTFTWDEKSDLCWEK